MADNHPSIYFDERRHRTPDSLRFLRGLCNMDPEARAKEFDRVKRAMDGWAEGYGSPPNHIIQAGGECSFGATDMHILLQEQLPDLLRLSYVCPFADVRDMCIDYLQDLQDRGIRIPTRKVFGASSFIPRDDMIPIEDDSNQETKTLLVDAFLESNRLEHLLQVMAYHPQYLECFLKTQHFLMRGDGPLPYYYRHYIAIMAAARHQCTYLINIHTLEFLLQGGDETWLGGLEYIPPKLRSLSEVNKILAHRPWLISKEHIKELVTGQDKWSLAELTQALVLLSHFHALCSFVYGCGISAEIDHPTGHSMVRSSAVTTDNGSAVNGANDTGGGGSNNCNGHAVINNEQCARELDCSVDLLVERMNNINQVSNDATEDEMRENYEKVESQNDECNCAAGAMSDGAESDESSVFPHEDVSRFVDDPDYRFQDPRGSKVSQRGGTGSTKSSGGSVSTFCTADYSWEHEGYSLSCRLYMEVGVALDEKFRIARNLTYYTMGDKDKIDTTSFRHAIWNYIHCLYGIRHVEYDYSVVNLLLDSRLKSFIKTVACYPRRVTREQYDSFMIDFKHSEKVHVNLMLLEARMQAELLYGLRAVSRYMCTRDPVPPTSS